MADYLMKTIATIHNGFGEKFGIPRQSGMTSAVSEIVFLPEYRNNDALRDIEQYSHLWLIWVFTEFQRDGWSPTVRPPRLGGNKRLGVFATRSPNRPNPIGLSVVELLRIEHSETDGVKLIVRGADLMNGTSILDIKPYLPYVDALPSAFGGFAHDKKDYELKVEFDGFDLDVAVEDRKVIAEIISQDPRPAYQNDDQRIYALSYGEIDVRFKVSGDVATIVSLNKRQR